MVVRDKVLVCESVDTVLVWVAVVVELSEVLDAVDAVVLEVSDVVVFSAQKPQLVSHMWAAGQVGQKTLSQVHPS